MLFTEPVFLLFFLIVFIANWIAPWNRVRKLFLLISSYIFYAGWDWRFSSLIAASTIIDYISGIMLGRNRPPGGRKSWLIFCLCANLGILGFFKYYNFFVSSVCSVLEAAGLSTGERTLEIILPVGISFFTFQTMSYTIDIYRCQLKPVKSFVDFALFVSFFPQLVAGPIVRAREFLPQLNKIRLIRNVAFRPLLTLFLIGFFKKTCIADNLAPFVDNLFSSPESYTALSVWLGVLFYAVQIYCDFSGYTDMAIAIAGLLGYKLRLNFNFPYFATSIQDFWRRWHISLSSWLRDYLYISLGGNRGNKIFTCRNLLLTMLLGGLWHGAAWNFVIWGGLHGIALILHREYSKYIRSFKLVAGFFQMFGVFITFYWVCLAWIFFRATSLSDAYVMTKAFVFFSGEGDNQIPYTWFPLLILLALSHWCSYKKLFSKSLCAIPDWIFAMGYGFIFVIVIYFIPLDYKPFIYFQF